MIGKKIWIIGCPGAGKTTLANGISCKLGYKKIELDALVWGANWTKTNDQDLLLRTKCETQDDLWIVDGKYDAICDFLVAKCDTIIFVDLPLHILFIRVLWRSLRNVLFQQKLWHGNQETLSRFLSKDSMPLYLARIFREERSKCMGILEVAKTLDACNVVHIRSTTDVQNFPITIDTKE